MTSVLLAVHVLLAGVAFQEDSITLPTYAPGGYDRTPLFYTGRVYQGAQGRVYPYPMQDVLHDEKSDETYKYLTLKNDWLEMGILPEHGGHLLNLTDRQTGFETFYRQHVIKPALIGMLGAWISGGVEWNFPHHHRATTAMPIDWRHASNDDGSETIWIGETELRRRLKWTIGLSMMPDRAVLQAENRFMNRQPWIETMIYWANVSVHCGDDYQILFPPSCHLGFDHHKNYWTSFPIGPRKEAHDLIPSQRSKYADDISGTMDLSWWKNFTIESRSIFAMDPDNAWLAGYDHKKQCGTAHVSNRHITVGKKFFLWGNFPEAHVWDTVLTDHDGPYLELMVGCWSDNQPDYSWIAPYETRTVKQFWFPVKGIGGVKNVTVDGAVNLERRGSDEMLMGFFSTRVLKDCTIRLYKDKEVVFTEKGVALDPNTPWCKPVKVDADTKDQQYTAAIADADGKVFLSYTPVPEDPHDPLPDVVANPKPPTEYTSAELAFLVGQRLEQFHNGLIDPVPYYKRALEIDPDYSQANLAMGVRLGKNGAFTEAEGYLRKAVDRVTQNYTRAKDAEPEYYLALCCRHQGKLKEAEDLFWRCTWRSTVKKESFFEIARICCLQGRYAEAHDVLEFSALPLGMDEAKFHTLHAYIHRKLATSPEANANQRQNWKTLAESNQKKAFACDPLEYWGRCEETFREGGDGAAALAQAEQNRGIKAQQMMESVCDYLGIGAWDEVIALCDAALAKAKVEKPYATEGALPLKETLAACDSYKNPMFAYFAAYARAKRDRRSGVGNRVVKTDWVYCFPSRLEELEVLQWAAANLKPDADTQYFLGEILWNMDQKDAALAAWKAATELNPQHALALRCIGFGLSHPGTYFTNTGVPTGIANREAYDFYLKALEADPASFRTLNECDKLAEKLKIPAQERIATMLKYRKTAEKYDDNILRLAYLHNAVGQHKEAYDILTTRRFHVWEGSEGLLAPFVEACIGLGKAAMVRKDHATALKYFEESTTYPANLQVGRPGDAGTEPKSRYFMAQCKKALGDDAGYKAELENSLKGWIKAGEMDYWRVKALRELGRDAECAPLIAELKQGISELEAPVPTVISAYAKFGGENSPMERAEKAREQAGALRKLLEEIVDGETAASPQENLEKASRLAEELNAQYRRGGFEGHSKACEGYLKLKPLALSPCDPEEDLPGLVRRYRFAGLMGKFATTYGYLDDAAELRRRQDEVVTAFAKESADLAGNAGLALAAKAAVQGTATATPTNSRPLPALVPAPVELREMPGALTVWGHEVSERFAVCANDPSLPEEGYLLSVTKSNIVIRSSSAAGRFYAVQTLRQLTVADAASDTLTIPCVEIRDYPRFAWRGVMLDESRHFFGKAAVKRLLDLMARCKLNVFHWHLTDNEGWRLPVLKRPDIARECSTFRCVRGNPNRWDNFEDYDDGPHFYTEKDIREIVDFACERHIRIVPEVDVPGHSHAVLTRHPDWGCAGSGDVFCIGNPESIRFFDDAFDSVVALFPGDVVHIGGDEVNMDGWRSCPRCQDFMRQNGMKSEKELQSWLARHISERLAKSGRRVVGWEEMILMGDVPPEGIVMEWRGLHRAVEAVKRGCPCVLTPLARNYFIYSQDVKEDPFHYLLPQHWDPHVSLETAYKYEPFDYDEIPQDKQHLILGGQSCNWTELTPCEAELQWKMWPRTFATAEIYWSPRGKKDFADFKRRVAVRRAEFVRNHVNCAPIE